VTNLFQQAKTVSIDSNKKPTSSASDRSVTVDLGEDLTTLASVKMLAKSLDGLCKTYDEKVKAKMADEFASQCADTGRRPRNFKGISAKVEASCELRKRSAASPMAPEEIALLEAMDIPLEDQTICEAVPERFFFNPSIVASPELANKISAALAAIPELQGMEILLKQSARAAETRKVVSDEALDAVAALKDVAMIKQLLPLVSSLAIRVKMNTNELTDAMAILKVAELNL
jgi:hypothetical protein